MADPRAPRLLFLHELKCFSVAVHVHPSLVISLVDSELYFVPVLQFNNYNMQPKSNCAERNDTSAALCVGAIAPK